jgi:hypothetical protein
MNSVLYIVVPYTKRKIHEGKFYDDDVFINLFIQKKTKRSEKVLVKRERKITAA